jgi:hypothetical protein
MARGERGQEEGDKGMSGAVLGCLGSRARSVARGWGRGRSVGSLGGRRLDARQVFDVGSRQERCPGRRTEGGVRLGIVPGRFLVDDPSTSCSHLAPEADVGWEAWSCLGDTHAAGWGSDSG